MPGGSLATLPSTAALDAINQGLLTTLPIQTAIRSAWVGAIGNNTQYNPTAPNSTAQAADGSQQQDILQPKWPRQILAGPGPESTLKWEDGNSVSSSLLKRLENLPAMWSAHDAVWSIQYVPDNAQHVCGRVFTQLPSFGNAVESAVVQPGIWYFDCLKPASFICGSEYAGREGRVLLTPLKVA